MSGSDHIVEIQAGERYSSFVEQAVAPMVLGLELPVTLLEDMSQGKIWVALDTDQRGSKRQKDLADIARILEKYTDQRIQGSPGDSRPTGW